jgi:hypothetical protein
MKENVIMKRYKVIVWGLGNVGRAAVRMIMEKESLSLVGVIDVDPNKIGKDAGELFGFGKTGVLVSSDTDKVFAMDADVILDYTPLVRDEKGGFTPSAVEICRALKTKKTVSLICPQVCSPALMPAIFPWSSAVLWGVLTKLL